MKVRLHPKARAELHRARNWYFERSPFSAFAFAKTIEGAISRIRESPNSFPVAEHGTRKFILQRFPFNIFYLIGETEIVSWRWRTRSDGQGIGPFELCLVYIGHRCDIHRSGQEFTGAGKQSIQPQKEKRPPLQVAVSGRAIHSSFFIAEKLFANREV
jgi:toxin ParE1/3/4